MEKAIAEFCRIVTPQRAFRGLLGVCLVLLAADLLHHKHSHFAQEDWFGFYGLFGFVACLVAVITARLLRVIVSRDEAYYDE